jgi:hypothetical protein
MTLGKQAEEAKGNGQIQGEGLSRPNVPNWNGLRKNNGDRRMERDFAKIGDLVREGTAVDRREQYPATFICDQPGAVRQGY